MTTKIYNILVEDKIHQNNQALYFLFLGYFSRDGSGLLQILMLLL